LFELIRSYIVLAAFVYLLVIKPRYGPWFSESIEIAMWIVVLTVMCYDLVLSMRRLVVGLRKRRRRF
jgi:hypothetical protein